jgi:D-alanyl-D-alanine carboxypeptidase
MRLKCRAFKVPSVQYTPSLGRAGWNPTTPDDDNRTDPLPQYAPFAIRASQIRACALAALAALATTLPASGEALLLIEANSGKVLQAENATMPWYPASTTKLMTTYVTLKAVREGRLTLDTPLTVSPNAVAQQPSKMGFRAGTTVTVDNALKMLMVKSANDMAVVLAEGVSGSVDKFSDEMNRASQRLGMTQSSWVNPNGLPADGQVTSARDMAILARALIREMPEYDFYWHIPAIRLGKRVMRNYNTLIGRYPGADGMKTGFICASGFNLVASATRDGKRLIAVVFGAPSGPVRAAKAAALLEQGFSGSGLNWLMPGLGTVESLPPIAAMPPNLREEMCGKHRRRPAAEEADDDDGSTVAGDQSSPQAFLLSSLKSPLPKPSSLIGPLVETQAPIPVYVGLPKPAPRVAAPAPAKKPATAALAPAAKPADKPTPKPAASTAAQPAGAAKSAAPKPAPQKTAAKPDPVKPGIKPLPSPTGAAPAAATKPAAAAKPATAKTTATPAAKPAGAAATAAATPGTAAKPAAPKAGPKPAASAAKPPAPTMQ